MALKYSEVCSIDPTQLSKILSDPLRSARLLDCRSFLEYNDNHIIGAINICSSKLIKRRLQQDKISLKDLLLHCRIEIEGTSDIIAYDQRSSSFEDLSTNSFMYILLKKLLLVFNKVFFLSGGFVAFHSAHPDLCENKMWKYPGLAALSQPCLPATSSGPTRILPFLYLGSEEDAHNKELLMSHNITYELNVSNKCPKPDFVADSHFLRIPVNDSPNEKLIPHFLQAFQFVDKVRESNECVLVHCLAGISRSPTIAIAYIMRYLQMACEDAYRYVKSKRATISPNFNFLGQLLEHEKQLISENVINKKTSSFSSPSISSGSFACSSSTISSRSSSLLQSESAEFFLQPPFKSCVSEPKKGFNLSLRISPPSNFSTNKDTSPTTALSQLQFDKENTQVSSTSSCSLMKGEYDDKFKETVPTSNVVPVSRPTRLLVKEQHHSAYVHNVIKEEEFDQWETNGNASRVSTGNSLNITITKGFVKPTGMDSDVKGKKCRVHTIVLEKDEDKVEEETKKKDESECNVVIDPVLPSPASSTLSCTSVGSKREGYMRSDSMSTSGIGSEVSENDLQASGSWELSESGNPDDGVFSDTYSLYPKSPKMSRSLQLWSSDSGDHWSSYDEGVSSCASSSIDVPNPNSLPASTALPCSTEESKLPEKRKLCSNGLSSIPHSSHKNRNNCYCHGGSVLEKRKSYTEGPSDDSFVTESSRRKRWSLVEDTDPSRKVHSDHGDSSEEDNEDSDTECKSDSCDHHPCDKNSTSMKRKQETSTSYSRKGKSISTWLDEFMTCRTCGKREFSRHDTHHHFNDGLYRVQSCPGIIGAQDWLSFHHQQSSVPESPPEPISDSVLLKMRSCRNRVNHQFFYDHPIVLQNPRSVDLGFTCVNKDNKKDPPGFCSDSNPGPSCGGQECQQLWCEVRNVTKENTADSNHSSSSTLASSSFSIVVQ